MSDADHTTPQSEQITPFLEPQPPADNDHVAPGAERFPEPDHPFPGSAPLETPVESGQSQAPAETVSAPVEQAAAEVAPTVPPPVVSEVAAGAETPAALTPPGDEQPAAAPHVESQPLDGTEGESFLIETQHDALAVLGEGSGLTAESLPPVTEDPFPEHPMTTLERIRAKLHHMGQEVHDDFKAEMEYLQRFFQTFL